MTHHQTMRCRRALREVHNVRDLSGFFEGAHDTDSLSGDRFLCLISRGADMMRAINSRLIRDRIIELRDGRGWFDRENVKSRAQAFCMNSVKECLLIDSLAARSVDEVSAITHRGKEFWSNKQARVRFEREMNANDVGCARNLKRCFFSFDTQLFSFLCRKAAAPCNHPHAESPGAGNHLLSNLADPNQAQCSPKQT